MTSPPTALGIIPGGQSGNPGSKYYDNFIDRWAAGEYLKLNFMQSDNSDGKTIGTLTLIPKNND
jgi:penicillin amidase